MEIQELLTRVDAKIKEAAEHLKFAEAEAEKARADLVQLMGDREDLVDVARRFGVPLVGAPEEAAEWKNLSRLDAVERALSEHKGSLHLTEILKVLESHGRDQDSYSLVSASLANIKERRGTVRSLGSGRWEYVRQPAISYRVNIGSAQMFNNGVVGVDVGDLSGLTSLYSAQYVESPSDE
jgi:hypothetical protein